MRTQLLARDGGSPRGWKGQRRESVLELLEGAGPVDTDSGLPASSTESQPLV